MVPTQVRTFGGAAVVRPGRLTTKVHTLQLKRDVFECRVVFVRPAQLGWPGGSRTLRPSQGAAETRAHHTCTSPLTHSLYAKQTQTLQFWRLLEGSKHSNCYTRASSAVRGSRRGHWLLGCLHTSDWCAHTRQLS